MSNVGFRSYSQFRNAIVTCERCGWSGEGRQTKLGLIYHRLVSEFCCPKCREAPNEHFLAVVHPFPCSDSRSLTDHHPVALPRRSRARDCRSAEGEIDRTWDRAQARSVLKR